MGPCYFVAIPALDFANVAIHTNIPPGPVRVEKMVKFDTFPKRPVQKLCVSFLIDGKTTIGHNYVSKRKSPKSETYIHSFYIFRSAASAGTRSGQRARATALPAAHHTRKTRQTSRCDIWLKANQLLITCQHKKPDINFLFVPSN